MSLDTESQPAIPPLPKALSLGHRQWRFPPPGVVGPEVTTLPPLLAQLLTNRGITGQEAMEAFIAADERLMGSPFDLPDMEKAVARVCQAMLGGEKIAVVGDFDADGVTATALLFQGFSTLGTRIIPYIPRRLSEERGLGVSAVETLLDQGVTLAMTADCSVADRETAIQARQRGMDIVVVDHHSMVGEPPPVLALVNPKRKDSSYGFPHLTGVGMAFKVVQALFSSMGKGEPPLEFLDLVALGTVADVAPLVGENRYLVKRGLECINRRPRLGLQQMIAQAGLKIGTLDADSISWVLAPRLNASGRLDHALPSYSLLVAESTEEAHSLAVTLEEMNRERQQHTEEVVAKARAQILSLGPEVALLMTESRDYFPGVIGLAAGRLSEEFNRPVILIATGEGLSRGSGRSISAFDMIAAISECQQLLHRFGGHPRAVGFTLAPENVPLLRDELQQIAAGKLEGVDLRPYLIVDVEMSPSALVGEGMRLLQKLAPFGYGNPVPAFLARGLRVEGKRLVGTNGHHLRMKLREGKAVWYGVAFDMGSLGEEIKEGSYLDVVYQLETDRWGGQELLQLRVLDFRAC